MSDLIGMAITVFCAVVASSGFWSYLQHKHAKNSAEARMLVGIGHDRIVYLGIRYLNRGYITPDEYKNLHNYLYVPYKELGGNGSAERIMKKVDNLPTRAPAHQDVEDDYGSY
ncbi:MAG: holin protein [Chaetfec virus UA24_144]|nr:MAG: holin protein [Chaetfec virus UA24_144]